jgi:predicted ester cyclase
MGVEPTNKALRWTGITIDRIANGKIAESWANWDMLGMLQQLGAIPRA